VRTPGSSNPIGEDAKEMKDLAEESVGLKNGRLVDRRRMEGTGCFFRRDLDLDFP
jgi:hypothetical protein